MILPSLRLGRWTVSAWRPAAIAAGALVVWFLLTLGYAWQTMSFFVSRDQWHFLPVVDHYLSGSLDWHDLWASHSEHVKPGYKLLFMLNAKYLGLSMRVEIIAGMLLLGLATLLLVREMRRTTPAHESMPWLAWLTAGIVMMSFNQWANYGYGLLALGGFGGTLIQLGLFIGFSRLLLRGLKAWEMTAWVLLLALGVFGFSGARSPAVVGTCLLAAALAYLLDPAARSRILRLGVPFLLLGVAAIGVYLSLLQLSSGRHMALADEARSILSDPLGAVVYVSGILAESMLDLSDPTNAAHLQLEVWVLSLLAYAVLGWCLWRYFKAGLWRRSWVPLMLITYSAAFTLEILIGRYGSENNVLHGSTVPRYVFDSHLWIVGCTWILGMDRAAARARLPSRYAALGMLALFLVLGTGNLYSAYRLTPFQVKGEAATYVKLRAVAAGTLPADALPKWECPDPHLCEQGIAILNRYHLDFARNDPP